MGRRIKSIRETFKTTFELLTFYGRRGQWWLMPMLVVGLLVGVGLAAGNLGVFAWVYAIF